MNKLFLLSITLFVLFTSLGISQTNIPVDDENRYLIFGLGRTQETAKAQAVTRAEYLSKNFGKKFKVVKEIYRKIGVGLLWQCRLDVSFYNYFEALEQKSGKIYTVGIAKNKEKAIEQAQDKMEQLSKNSGHLYNIKKQTSEQLHDKSWLCSLEAEKKEDADKLLRNQFQIGAAGATKNEAKTKAEKQVQILESKLNKSLKVIKESFTKYSNNYWLCCLTVSTNNQKILKIVETGKNSQESQDKAKQKWQSNYRQMKIIKVHIEKLNDNLFLCILTLTKTF